MSRPLMRRLKVLATISLGLAALAACSAAPTATIECLNKRPPMRITSTPE